MLKLQVIMDEVKIRREKIYSAEKIYKAIDGVFVDDYGFVKGKDGFYYERGQKDDYANFWTGILLLKDQDWFMDNVKVWLWFNSDDSDDPEDFAVEDIRAHYLAKRKKSA